MAISREAELEIIIPKMQDKLKKVTNFVAAELDLEDTKLIDELLEIANDLKGYRVEFRELQKVGPELGDNLFDELDLDV